MFPSVEYLSGSALAQYPSFVVRSGQANLRKKMVDSIRKRLYLRWHRSIPVSLSWIVVGHSESENSWPVGSDFTETKTHVLINFNRSETRYLVCSSVFSRLYCQMTTHLLENARPLQKLSLRFAIRPFFMMTTLAPWIQWNWSVVLDPGVAWFIISRVASSICPNVLTISEKRLF